MRSVRTGHACNFQDMWKWKSARPTNYRKAGNAPASCKNKRRELFFRRYYCYSPPLTSYSPGGLLFCKSYLDLVSVGHESGQDCLTVCNIIQNYGEASSIFLNNTGILFSLEEVFYLTEWFLSITGDKFRESDWNWRIWLQTRVWAILSAHAQMSWAKWDVSTWQMLLVV